MGGNSSQNMGSAPCAIGMLDDLLRGLEKIGLEEKEGRVYLALLSHPGGRVQEIAAATDLPRASCYDLLDDLSRRGFVTVGEGETGKRYFPQSPENLLSILHKEEEELADRILKAQGLVPMLTVLHNPVGPKPRVRYKEGIKGLRELQKEYEALPHDILQIIGFDAFLALHDPQATREHRGGLIDSDRKIRAIIVTDQRERIPRMPNLEARILPPELFQVMGEMTVCGDRALFFSYASDMVALEIHSPAIAGTCRAALELAWKQASTLS